MNQSAQAGKPSSLKERIENNLVVFFLGALLTGFLAGMGAYQGALKLVDYTSIANERLSALKDDLERRGKEIAALKSKLKATEARVAEQRWIRISRVEGLDGSRARVIARVNGRAYSYPSRIVWSKVGPSMSTEEFPLPVDVKTYDISFELLISSGADQFRRFQSQEVISVKSWPFEGEYKILTLLEESVTPAASAGLSGVGSVRSVPAKERNALARIAFEVR